MTLTEAMSLGYNNMVVANTEGDMNTEVILEPTGKDYTEAFLESKVCCIEARGNNLLFWVSVPNEDFEKLGVRVADSYCEFLLKV